MTTHRTGTRKEWLAARLELLEGEVSHLGRELSEAQERLDFTERVLAQVQESRRVGPES